MEIFTQSGFAIGRAGTFVRQMIVRKLAPLPSLLALLVLAGCSTPTASTSESSEPSTPTAKAAEEAEPAAVETKKPAAATESRRTAATESKAESSIAEKGAVPAAEADTARGSWREARTASSSSSSGASTGGSSAGSSVAGGRAAGTASTTSETAKLTEQLTAAAKELAVLRAANAKLRAEKLSAPTASSSAATSPVKADPAEEKLNASFKSFAAFKQEVASVFAETDRVRQENAAMSSNLKSAVEQAEKARTALAKMEDDLVNERRSRAELERTVAQLREQLRAVARAVSAAGLSVEKLSGSTESTSGKR